MPRPTAIIIKKTPIIQEDQPDIIKDWDITTATAKIRIVKPVYLIEGPVLEGEKAGGVELAREDTGETILCPFQEKSEWQIQRTRLASLWNSCLSPREVSWP